MLKRLPICLVLIASLTARTQQFKNDNVTYKTVFPQDLCKTLQENPGYTILDVRSDGEYYDTLSSSQSLNIGHLKNALHINITELPNRWKELLQLKDKPLFVYCSHSQRSRRASRLLADSGFTKIFNINGGLTDFYYQSAEISPCPTFTIATSLPYKIVSAQQMTANVRNKMDYFLIDIRSDSLFNQTTSDQRAKTEGRFDKAINIPYTKFSEMNRFDFPNKSIMLIDEFGDESPKAAKLLIEKGYKDINILFGGMSDWVRYSVNATDKPIVKWTPGVNYKFLVLADKFNRIATKEKTTIIDARTKEEFTNQSKNYWQNIGQIKNAINIPASDIETNLSLLPVSKDAQIVLYVFNTQKEVYDVAIKLSEKGYKKVNILYGGIWNLRWASHNLKGQTQVSDWVINVPPQNE